MLAGTILQVLGTGGIHVRATAALARFFDALLPEAAFPREDHQRRIRASFILALAALQAVGSVLFMVTELMVRHWQTASILAVGSLLPLWPGMRMRRDGDVERWSQFFIANMFVLLGAILLASGGHSIGVVMALPALLLISSLVSRPRQILFWSVFVIALLLAGNVMRGIDAAWPIKVDAQWARSSLMRVPVILTVCMLGMSVLLRMLLDNVFSDLAESRKRELAAVERARDERQRFSDFADIAADWFWETDANLRLVYVSPGISGHTGMRPEDVLGRHPVSIVEGRSGDSSQWREVEARMARGEPFLDEQMAWRDKEGRQVIFRNIGRPLRDAGGRFLGYRGAVTNITENWRLTRELERLARTDPLTGLLNRRAFAQVLGNALAHPDEGAADWWLLQLDLDQFKAINEDAGHAMADKVLMRVADLLRECGLPPDALARIGGDAFCALVREPEGEAVGDYADLILAGLARFELEFNRSIGASIGIVRVRPQPSDENWHLQAVDEACRRAKREGSGRVVVD